MRNTPSARQVLAAGFALCLAACSQDEQSETVMTGVESLTDLPTEQAEVLRRLADLGREGGVFTTQLVAEGELPQFEGSGAGTRWSSTDLSISNVRDAFVATVTYPENAIVELNTSFADDELHIKGSVSIETMSERDGASWQVSRNAKFDHSYKLPEDVDANGIRQSTSAGQIVVTIPKI